MDLYSKITDHLKNNKLKNKKLKNNKPTNNKTQKKQQIVKNKKIQKAIHNKFKQIPNTFIVPLTKIEKNSLLSKIKKTKPYRYEDLLQEEKELSDIFNLENTINGSKKGRSDSQLAEGFLYTRSVAGKATQHLKIKVTNAYAKLWEIYTHFSNQLFNDDEMKAFHVAEAPGNWIKCTENYLQKLSVEKKKMIDYEWRGNTLNPNSKKNIERFGNAFLNDAYGLLAKHKEQWIFGEDDTGDITISENIRWYRKYGREWCPKIDLITGDAGIGYNENITLIQLQKLDYSQFLMGIALAQKGSSCIFKHFSYFDFKIPNSLSGSGYFTGFMYLYFLLFEDVRLIKPVTSSPRSNEFYIVAMKFKGIDDKTFDKLLGILDKFVENQCFIAQKEIPKDFSDQIIKFNRRLMKLNMVYRDYSNIILGCKNQGKDYQKLVNCHNRLKPDSIKRTQKQNYKVWNSKFKLDVYKFTKKVVKQSKNNK